MRQIIFLMLALALMMSSCKKDQLNTTDQALPVAELTAAVSNYVENYYPDATILSAVKVSNGIADVKVTLNTTEVLAFTGKGEFLGDGDAYFDGHGNHSGDTLVGNGHHGGGNHGGGGGHHGGGHHGGGHGNSIPIDSLSVTIVDFITVNYPSFTIKHAELDSICQFGNVTEVMINDSTASLRLKLAFDSSDAFLFIAERALFTDVPQAVIDSITQNYPAYTSRDRCEKFTLAAGNIQFKIYLTDGQTRLSVIFNEDGTVVCEN
jgi:hypothetical protein